MMADKDLVKRALLDTNFLIRLNQFQQSVGKSGSILEKLAEKYRLCICLQNLVEYWSVASRAKQVNGLGLPLQEVNSRIHMLMEKFEMLSDSPKVIDIWLKMCAREGISGKHAHDARLASTAIANDVDTIVTLNRRDFQNLKGILVADINGYDFDKNGLN